MGRDKVIRKSKVSNEKWTLAMKGQVLLTKFSQLVLGEEKRGETNEREKEKELERESPPSL